MQIVQEFLLPCWTSIASQTFLATKKNRPEILWSCRTFSSTSPRDIQWPRTFQCNHIPIGDHLCSTKRVKFCTDEYVIILKCEIIFTVTQFHYVRKIQNILIVGDSGNRATDVKNLE